MVIADPILEVTHFKVDDYKNFFDETPVALIRTDFKTGKFLLANKYAIDLFGFKTLDEMLEHSKEDFVSPEDRKKMLNQLKKHDVIQNYELKLTVKNKIVWVSARLRLNRQDQCIEGSLIDITESVILKQRLKDNELAQMKELSIKLDRKIASLAS